MRHGWKIRMDERQYFESKKNEREERQQMMAFIRMKMSQELSETLSQLKKHEDIH